MRKRNTHIIYFPIQDLDHKAVFTFHCIVSCQTKATDASKHKLIVQLRRLFINEKVILIFIASYHEKKFQANFVREKLIA